jgi:hypothetical protein
MAVYKSAPIKFVEEIKKALGLNVDIIGVTIRSHPRDLVTAEVVIPMVEDQDKKVAEVLRRYRLVPIEGYRLVNLGPGDEVPAPTADTLTPAPFDPTP